MGIGGGGRHTGSNVRSQGCCVVPETPLGYRLSHKLFSSATGHSKKRDDALSCQDRLSQSPCSAGQHFPPARTERGEGKGNPLWYSCLEKSHGWRSLVGYSPWGLEELDTAEQLHFHFSLSCTGEGNGNPLQCTCLENPRDGGVWWAAVCGVAQSQTRLKRLSSSSPERSRMCLGIHGAGLLHRTPPPLPSCRGLGGGAQANRLPLGRVCWC